MLCWYYIGGLMVYLLDTLCYIITHTYTSPDRKRIYMNYRYITVKSINEFLNT